MLTDDGGDSGVWPLLHGLNNSHRLRFVLCAYHVQLPRQHWWCNLLSWTPLALPMPKRDCSRGPVPTGPLHFIREKNLAQRHAGTEAEAASVLINQSSHTLSMTIITKQQSTMETEPMSEEVVRGRRRGNCTCSALTYDGNKMAIGYAIVSNTAPQRRAPCRHHHKMPA
jgi:hypothetical protein